MNRSDAYWNRKIELAGSLAAKAVMRPPQFSSSHVDFFPRNLTVILYEAVVAGCMRAGYWVPMANEMLEQLGRERAAELAGFGDWLTNFLVGHGQLEGPRREVAVVTGKAERKYTVVWERLDEPGVRHECTGLDLRRAEAR